jgi:hypothetical protein
MLLLPVCALAARPSTKPSVPRAQQDAADNQNQSAQVEKGGETDWGTGGDGAANDSDWREAGVAQVQLKGNTPLTFAPTTRPVAVVGDEFWDLVAGRPIMKLRGATYDTRALRALSGDGTLFATVLPRDPNAAGDQPAQIGVWLTTTGHQVSRVRLNNSIVKLLCVTPRVLLACSWFEAGGLVETWDPITGRPLRRFKTQARIHEDNSAASPDGRFVAAVNDGVIILDVASGRQVARLKSPKKVRDPYDDFVVNPKPVAAAPAPAEPPAKATPKPRAGASAKANNAPPALPKANVVSPLSWSASGLCFSPDGKELAGLFTFVTAARIIVWDVKGNVLQEAWVPDGSFAMEGPALEWVPDRSGLLVYGRYLFSRSVGRVVWEIQPPDNDHRFHFLEKNWLMLADGARSNSTLAGVRVPWDRINKSLEAMSLPKTAAHVRPGVAVALKVEVGQLHSMDKQQMTEVLTRGFSAHFTRGGLRIDDTGRCVLRCTYEETVTDQRIIARVTFQLTAPKEKEPVWQTERNNMFIRAADAKPEEPYGQLHSLMEGEEQVLVPYFVPADKSLSPLPLIEQEEIAE